MVFRSEYCGEVLVRNGFWAYYSSETARDMLLEKGPRVINILTNADLFRLTKLFPDLCFRNGRKEHAYLNRDGTPVHFFISEYPYHNAVKIPGMVEVEKEALRHAIKNELFRINSFFYNLSRKIFHDPLDAYFQLKRGVIQTIGQPGDAALAFPVIALKTAKIFCETGFALDEELYTFLNTRNFLEVYENVNEEMVSNFIDISVSQRSFGGLSFLDEWGVLELVLPEVARLKYVYQDKDHHPEGNAFWHTLRCLNHVKKPNRNLIMAILLHDTGKATTMSSRSARRFPYHSNESRKIAERVLHRFHFETQDIQEVLFLVENHMILDGISRQPKNVQKRIFSSPYFPNLLELYRADIESGYHSVKSYYQAARVYRAFKRKMKLKEQIVHL